MARDLDLARRLRLAGLDVTEVAYWQTRGSDTFRPRGSVNHHTAGPRTGVQPSLGIVINGRGGSNPLPGPLANVHQPREESLRVNLVAAGRANHAGLGGYSDLDTNTDVYGLEVEHCGYPDEPLSPVRYDCMVRIHAAFAFDRFDPIGKTCQHYQWTARKIDFVRQLVDPTRFVRDVEKRVALMHGVNPDPPIPPQESDMSALVAHPDGHLEEFDVYGGKLVQNWQLKLNGVDWSGWRELDTTYDYVKVVGGTVKPDGSVAVTARTKTGEVCWWYTPETAWQAAPMNTR